MHHFWWVIQGSVSYLCIGGTQDRNKALLLAKYIKTRFVRFLIKQALSGINISATSFQFVPVLYFDENDGINWSSTIKDIDEQLFAKYQLSNEDITYIKDAVAPMEELTYQDILANHVNQLVNQY